MFHLDQFHTDLPHFWLSCLRVQNYTINIQILLTFEKTSFRWFKSETTKWIKVLRKKSRIYVNICKDIETFRNYNNVSRHCDTCRCRFWDAKQTEFAGFSPCPNIWLASNMAFIFRLFSKKKSTCNSSVTSKTTIPVTNNGKAFIHHLIFPNVDWTLTMQMTVSLVSYALFFSCMTLP